MHNNNFPLCFTLIIESPFLFSAIVTYCGLNYFADMLMLGNYYTPNIDNSFVQFISGFVRDKTMDNNCYTSLMSTNKIPLITCIDWETNSYEPSINSTYIFEPTNNKTCLGTICIYISMSAPSLTEFIHIQWLAKISQENSYFLCKKYDVWPS